MRINLTTPMSDDKERERHTKAVIDAIERYTEKRMNDEYGKIHTDGSRSGEQPLLKPCPFCGSIDLFVDTVDGSLPPQTGQTVSCEDCTAKASYGDWNTRQPTQSDALREENERLREAVEKERAAIVAWLMREEDDYPSGKYSGFAAIIREEIEAGEHLKEQSK